jgi:hypothetical protein
MPGASSLQLDPAAVRAVKASVDTSGEAVWRVTSLLDRLGVYRLTEEVREAITDALGEFEIDPPLTGPQVKRHYTVRITRPGQLARFRRRDDGRSLVAPSDSVALFACRTDGGIEPIAHVRDAVSNSLVWVDVHIDALREAPEPTAQLESLLGELASGGEEEVLAQEVGGLSAARRIAEDLLYPDFRPDVDVYGPAASIRTVAAYRALPDEPDPRGSDVTDPSISKAGSVIFQLVEFAVGARWILTARHGGETYDGVGPDPEGGVAAAVPCDAYSRGDLLRALHRRWRRATQRQSSQGHGTLTAGDLGILILHELCDSYQTTQLALGAWLDQWELQFFERTSGAERRTLVEVRTLVSELRDRIAFFARPRHAKPESAWFPNVTDVEEARHVAGIVGAVLDDLRAVSDRVQSALELISTYQGDKVKQRIDLVAFFFLVPTVVAGIYGANTKLPGGGEWSGFTAMFVAMAVLWVALAVYLRLSESNRGGFRR